MTGQEFIDWLGKQIGLNLKAFAEAWQRLLDGIINTWLDITGSVGAAVENVLDTFGEAFGVVKANVLTTANASIATPAHATSRVTAETSPRASRTRPSRRNPAVKWATAQGTAANGIVITVKTPSIAIRVPYCTPSSIRIIAA